MKIDIDYPVDPLVRYGWGKPVHPELNANIARLADNYWLMLQDIKELAPALDKINVKPLQDLNEVDLEPSWVNGWFSGLDAAVLYSTLTTNDPKQLIEVGSGCSTKFARRAINDHGLKTKLLSIDPMPRSAIDDLCDEVIRARLEDSVTGLVDKLAPGDIFFLDGSHRAFQNSDVTVFFLEILPRLKPGVLIHLHDIFLPSDYPTVWTRRYYSEQYMLAAWLLGNKNVDIQFPSAWVTLADRNNVVDGLAGEGFWRGLKCNLEATGMKGTSFWFRT